MVVSVVLVDLLPPTPHPYISTPPLLELLLGHAHGVLTGPLRRSPLPVTD